MATATTTITTLATSQNSIPATDMSIIKTLTPSQAFPYHPSRLETLFFTIPLEIRTQIYEYVFYTPNTAFQKTLKSWRQTPDVSDLKYAEDVNGKQLLAINRRIRSEALPVMNRTMAWRLRDYNHLREFLNTATLADCSHLHVRRLSFVLWRDILRSYHTQRWTYTEQASFIVSTVCDLPSLRELELSPEHMPENTSDYAHEDWLALMQTLSANRGVLRVVAASLEQPGWWSDWRAIGGRNFAWTERVMLHTHVDIRSWDELVEGDWGNFDWNANVFVAAMDANWRRGPLKKTTVTSTRGDRTVDFNVRFYGVPENIRRSEENKAVRRDAKKAFEEQRKVERGRKAKTSPKLAELALSDEEDEVDGSGEEVGMRRRKEITREEARSRRLEKQRGGR